MKKRRIIVLACSVLVLLLCAVYYFRFTRNGEELLYNIFGGNDLHIVAGDKEIYWFDVRHSNDPASPMFERLESSFSDFNPDLVLVEGGYNDFSGDRDTAIHNGESAFASWLAKKNAVLVEDIEPPFDMQIEYLQTKYSTNELFAMYLIREISSEQFMPDNSQTDFNELLSGFARQLKINEVNHSANSLEDVLGIINSYLPEAINADNWRTVDAKPVYNVYAREGGVLYPVYNDTVNFRNIWLVELLKEKKKTYNKIYIVMGARNFSFALRAKKVRCSRTQSHNLRAFITIFLMIFRLL